MLGQGRWPGWPGLLAICLLNGVFLPTYVLARNQEYYNFGFVRNLTQHLHLRHKLKCFITFAANRKPMNPLPGMLFARSLDRILVEDLNIPHVTWGLQTNGSLSSILTAQSLVFATINNLSPEQEPMLEVVDKMLDGRHDLRVLFILKAPAMSTPLIEQIYELFVWCWQRNFINVALTYQRITFINGSYDVHDELFSYTPFPKLRLLNVTGLGVTFNWEALDISNVQGYEFRVPVFQDVAQAFVLPDGQLYGSLGLMLSNYIIHINGRLRVVQTPHVNEHNYHSYTLMSASRGAIDIGVHTFTQMTLRSKQAEVGLVTAHTKTCLMVPWQKEQPLNRFIRYTVRYNGMLFLTLVLSLMLGWHLYARVASKGFYLALVIFQLQSVNESVFRRFTNAYKIMHVTFLFSAFIQWNVRMGYLSAGLSVKLIPPQINNLEDFLRSPLRIMVTETEVAMYFTRELLPAALQSRLLVVNASTLLEHRDNLNTSYAYCSTSRRWQLVQYQQAGLRHPLFRRLDANLCTSTYFRQVPMQRNSPFRDKFLRFCIVSFRTGFNKKWEQLSIIEAVKLGLLKIYQDVELPYASLNLKSIEVLLKIYVLCVVVCLVCLLCEIIWHHRVNKRHNINGNDNNK